MEEIIDLTHIALNELRGVVQREVDRGVNAFRVEHRDLSYGSTWDRTGGPETTQAVKNVIGLQATLEVALLVNVPNKVCREHLDAGADYVAVMPANHNGRSVLKAGMRTDKSKYKLLIPLSAHFPDLTEFHSEATGLVYPVELVRNSAQRNDQAGVEAVANAVQLLNDKYQGQHGSPIIGVHDELGDLTQQSLPEEVCYLSQYALAK